MRVVCIVAANARILWSNPRGEEKQTIDDRIRSERSRYDVSSGEL